MDSGSSKEEHLRIAHDGPPDGDTLALAARELARAAIQKVLHLEDPGRFGDLGFLFRLRGPVDRQTEGHVVPHRHVRKDRVGLKDHRDPAFFRRQVVDPLAIDLERAVGDVFEPGDHAQKGRLSASRRADKDNEFAILDVDIDTLDDLRRAVALPYA